MGLNSSAIKLYCISFLLIAGFVFSCTKNIKDHFPEEGYCEKYAGLYDMYDPIENEHYELIIACESGIIFGNTKWDSAHFNNFGNKFNFGQGVGLNTIGGVIINPLIDSNGKRWNFSNIHMADTLARINVLIGDSIYLKMKIDNTAYWVEDEVPYQSISTTHAGVKIH